MAIPTPKAGPFENPKLNAFLNSLTAAPVGSPKVPKTTGVGGYGAPNMSGYIPNFSPAQTQALSAAGVSPAKAVTDPKILQILKEVNTQNAEIKNNGGQVPNTTHHHGFFSSVMDVLSRPMYAMAEGSKRLAENITSGDSLVHDLEGFGSGAVSGIEGKSKTDFTQVLQEAQDVRHAKNMGMSGADAVAWAKAHPGGSGSIGTLGKIGGFGLDIIGDPTSYLGVGLVSKGAKAAELAGEAAKSLETINAAKNLAPETKDLLTGIHYASGKIGKQAAISAEGKVGDIASRVAKAEGSSKYFDVLKQGSGEVPDKQLYHLAKEAQKNRESEVMSNILDNYNKVTSEAVNRHFALKLPGGTKLTIPGIPNLDLITATAKGAAMKVDPVASAMRTLDKSFNTVAKSFPELHEAYVKAFDYGITQARAHGREIRRALNPLGQEGRTEAFTAFLHGHPSNQMITLPHGETVEATQWMHGRLDPIKLNNHVNNWKPEDWKPWLPSGLEMKKEKIVIDGKKVDDPNWLFNSVKNWNMKDGGKAQWFLESGYHQLTAYKTMLEDMGKQFGATLPEQHTAQQLELMKGLKEKGWVSPKGVPELANHVFHPETAAYISQISSLLKNNREWSKFWQRWAKIQQPIKFMLTLPNPSFHIHNAVGDAFVNHLDNIMPSHYIKAAQVMKNRSKWFETYNPAENQYPLLSREGNPLAVARMGGGPDSNLIKNTMGLKSADGKVHPYITQAEVYAGYNTFGLRQNYAADLGFQENSPIGALKGMVDKVTSASEAREDYMRLAHFIGLIEKNGSNAKTLEDAMNFAARRVRQTHFDYTDFTKFEKQVMSQVVPFYKWTRKALPLFTQILVTHPGKAALVPKSLRLMSNLTGNVEMTNNDVLPNLENAIVPDWMRTSGYVPTGTAASGYPMEGYISNPMSDMFTQQFGGIGTGIDASNINQMLMGMTSPIINMADELKNNKSNFTGGKIINTGPGKSPGWEQFLKYLSTQVPIVNAATQQVQTHGTRDVIPHVSDTAFNWLTGASEHVDSPARQKGELLRQRDVGRAILRELKYKNHGLKKTPRSSGFKKTAGTSSGGFGKGF